MASIGHREAIKRIGAFVGGGLSAPTLAGLLAGCEIPAGSDFRARTLAPAQLRRVEEIAEMIIPETDTPGAAAARVHHFVDMMLTDFRLSVWEAATHQANFLVLRYGVEGRLHRLPWLWTLVR